MENKTNSVTVKNATERAIITLAVIVFYCAAVAIWRQGWWWLLLLPMLASVWGIRACAENQGEMARVNLKAWIKGVIGLMLLFIGFGFYLFFPKPGTILVFLAYLCYLSAIHDWWKHRRQSWVWPVPATSGAVFDAALRSVGQQSRRR